MQIRQCYKCYWGIANEEILADNAYTDASCSDAYPDDAKFFIQVKLILIFIQELCLYAVYHQKIKIRK